jgi:hypothetical protein
MKCHNLSVSMDFLVNVLVSSKTSRCYLRSRVRAEKVTNDLPLEGFGTDGRAGEV